MKIQNVKITVRQSDIPIKGNAIASGDDEYDRNVEDQIISDLECNVWAWCDITVSLELEVDGNTLQGGDSIGACNYRNEKEFMESLYPEMVQNAINEAIDGLKRSIVVVEATKPDVSYY
jgi:hypothetical protein